ncbi:MAG: hypothetical protein ACI8S6_002649 [Myxococcota bacterium]
MQWQPLDASRLEALSPKDRGERWLQAVAAAGVERIEGEAPPQQAMSKLYAAAWALAEHDEAVSALRVTDRFHFSAPPGTWLLLLPGAYVLFHAPRLRELEAQLRRSPDQTELRQQRDAIRAALARHQSAPPAVWTDDGLR